MGRGGNNLLYDVTKQSALPEEELDRAINEIRISSHRATSEIKNNKSFDDNKNSEALSGLLTTIISEFNRLSCHRVSQRQYIKLTDAFIRELSSQAASMRSGLFSKDNLPLTQEVLFNLSKIDLQENETQKNTLLSNCLQNKLVFPFLESNLNILYEQAKLPSERIVVYRKAGGQPSKHHYIDAEAYSLVTLCGKRFTGGWRRKLEKEISRNKVDEYLYGTPCLRCQSSQRKAKMNTLTIHSFKNVIYNNFKNRFDANKITGKEDFFAELGREFSYHTRKLLGDFMIMPSLESHDYSRQYVNINLDISQDRRFSSKLSQL